MSSFIPSSKNGQVLELDLRDLTDHPLLAGIPVWDKESPEFAALRESIRDRGLDYPLLVDNSNRVVDGRNRRNAIAALAGLGGPAAQRVPCRIVNQDDAAGVIVSSLVNRRHLARGALVYIVAPLFENVLAESKARRFANYAKSTSAPESALSALSGKGAVDIAAKLGVSPRLFEQALKLRRMFEEMGAEVRAQYEPRILGPWQDESGEWQEPVGLGYMINGLTSLLADKIARKNLGKRAQHDRLFIGCLPKLGLHWKKATEEQRAAIAAKLKAEVLKYPAELRDELAGACRAAAKAEK